MRLELYTAGVSQASFLDWRARLSETHKQRDWRVVHSPIQETPEVLREKLPVVLDELCSILSSGSNFIRQMQNSCAPSLIQITSPV